VITVRSDHADPRAPARTDNRRNWLKYLIFHRSGDSRNAVANDEDHRPKKPVVSCAKISAYLGDRPASSQDLRRRTTPETFFG
jgi:hypothetical protein